MFNCPPRSALSRTLMQLAPHCALRTRQGAALRTSRIVGQLLAPRQHLLPQRHRRSTRRLGQPPARALRLWIARLPAAGATPSALNVSGGPQRLYPQCIDCSREQGLEIARRLSQGGSVMTLTKKLAPPNSVVLVSDVDGGEIPKTMGGSLVSATDTCVAIGCLSEDDGETEFVLAPLSELDRADKPVYEGMLRTPKHCVVIRSVLGEHCSSFLFWRN